MKIKTSRKSGFTLVEIMIVVAIIGLLAAIAIPNFIKARTTSQKNACINNLRQIDAAIQQWALEDNQAASATVSAAVLKPYLGRGGSGESIDTSTGYHSGLISCPAGGAYSVSNVKSKPTCSLSAQGHVLP